MEGLSLLFAGDVYQPRLGEAAGFDPALLDERYRALLGEAKPGEAPMVAARSSGA